VPPFSVSGCAPSQQRCDGRRGPVRVSKVVVRPGRKGGGTTLVFTLTRGVALRFTIVRVYPSCKRVGSYTVRAHPGVNRVRFNGRFRGRPLAAGTYRLFVQTRGQTPTAVAVTMVIARGKASQAFVRRALTANSCSPAESRGIESALGSGASSGDEGTGAPADADQGTLPDVILRVAGAVKGVTHKASLGGGALPEPLMVIFGLLTLASVGLGTFVLVVLARSNWYT
jgi:hypothetical protein